MSDRPAEKLLRARLLLAAGAPLALLLCLEATLRLAGFGHSTRLFIPDDRSGFLRTNPFFTSPFLPASFDIAPLPLRLPKHKPPGHVRVFVLGESAARGVPEPGFGMAAHLRAQLAHACPGTVFEVYNLGIVAINSHVVLEEAREAAALEPDLFVVYMGNNEVVGPYGPGSANLPGMPPLWLIRASAWTAGTRTGQLFARLAERLWGGSRRAVEWHGMSTFVGHTVSGDDPRLVSVYRNFESNLEGVVDAASRAGAKVVLVTLVSNLDDCPPFASVHGAAFDPAKAEAWRHAESEGRRRWEVDPRSAAQDLRRALALDPAYASTHFMLGKALEAEGDLAGARGELLQAEHWDALRFRPDPQINEICRSVAARHPGSVALVDAARILGSDPASSGPPAGRNLLWEHVHLNWDGNLRVGRLMAEGAAPLLTPGLLRQGWPDEAAIARALGYTVFGRQAALRALGPIRGKPPFSDQLTFGEDQLRYAYEAQEVASETAAPGAAERALGQIRAAAGADPGNADLQMRLAEVALESGQAGQALQALDRALELEPPSADRLVRRAHTLAALGRLAEAQAEALRAIAINPEHLPAYTELAAVVARTGDFALARSTLERAIRARPGSDYLRLTLADVLFHHGDRQEALDACQGVLERDPGSAEALARLVSLAAAEGRKDDAFALMSRAREHQPLNFENDMALARALKARGDTAGVVACLELAAACGPAQPEVHVFLARHYGQAGKTAQAELEFARARTAALLTGRPELAQKLAELGRLPAR